MPNIIKAANIIIKISLVTPHALIIIDIEAMVNIVAASSLNRFFFPIFVLISPYSFFIEKYISAHPMIAEIEVAVDIPTTPKYLLSKILKAILQIIVIMPFLAGVFVFCTA